MRARGGRRLESLRCTLLCPAATVQATSAVTAGHASEDAEDLRQQVEPMSQELQLKLPTAEGYAGGRTAQGTPRASAQGTPRVSGRSTSRVTPRLTPRYAATLPLRCWPASAQQGMVESSLKECLKECLKERLKSTHVWGGVCQQDHASSVKQGFAIWHAKSWRNAA